MHSTRAKEIRVTISLHEGVYDCIRDISEKMGLRPSTWIKMVCTARTKNVQLRIYETLTGEE